MGNNIPTTSTTTERTTTTAAAVAVRTELQPAKLNEIVDDDDDEDDSDEDLDESDEESPIVEDVVGPPHDGALPADVDSTTVSEHEKTAAESVIITSTASTTTTLATEPPTTPEPRKFPSQSHPIPHRISFIGKFRFTDAVDYGIPSQPENRLHNGVNTHRHKCVTIFCII